MSVKPTFGGRIRASAYYDQVLAFVTPLRETLTLNAICTALNTAGLTTPSGLTWTKGRLSNFLRAAA
jgi:hypothetical protein